MSLSNHHGWSLKWCLAYVTRLSRAVILRSDTRILDLVRPSGLRQLPGPDSTGHQWFDLLGSNNPQLTAYWRVLVYESYMRFLHIKGIDEQTLYAQDPPVGVSL